MLKTPLRNAVLAAGLALVATAATASAIPDYPFVHVTGSAFQAVPPDLGSIDFEIVAADADPAAARTVLETRVAEVRALAQQLGLDPADVTVREVRQALRKGETGIYEVRCDVNISLSDLGKWRDLAGGLLGKPNLDGFASSFDLSTMGQVKDALVTQAIQDARHQAEVIAAASGRRVGVAMAATPEALKNVSTAMGLQREEFRGQHGNGRAAVQEVDGEQLLAIPAMKLNEQVDVIFRLENPAPVRARR